MLESKGEEDGAAAGGAGGAATPPAPEGSREQVAARVDEAFCAPSSASHVSIVEVSEYY